MCGLNEERAMVLDVVRVCSHVSWRWICCWQFLQSTEVGSFNG